MSFSDYRPVWEGNDDCLKEKERKKQPKQVSKQTATIFATNYEIEQKTLRLVIIS